MANSIECNAITENSYIIRGKPKRFRAIFISFHRYENLYESFILVCILLYILNNFDVAAMCIHLFPHKLLKLATLRIRRVVVVRIKCL